MRLYIPVSGNYNEKFEFIKMENLKNVSFDGNHSCESITEEEDCKGRYGMFLKSLDISIHTIKHDIEFLKSYILQSPFSSVQGIHGEMIMKNQSFTREEIRKLLHQIRNDLYPNDNYLVFTKEYCKCLDFDKSGMSLLQAHLRHQLKKRYSRRCYQNKRLKMLKTQSK